MGITNQDIRYIVSFAQQKDFIIYEDTVKALDSSGFMSRVFGARTDQGKVIIHIVSTPIAEQAYQQVPDKIAYVGRLLENIPEVPMVYVTGRLPEGGYFMVQEYKSGHPMGKRTFSNSNFSDSFLVSDPVLYMKELQNIILTMHTFTSDKYGHLDFSKNLAEARHNSWESFLADNFERSIQTLSASQEEVGINYFDTMSLEEVQDRGRSILRSNKELFYTEKAHFIHGDILNYSNVLVSDSHIEGIIDFEWALFGHPAWEFVFRQQPPLDVYVPEATKRKIILEGIDFKRSIELHNIFWCAWGASVHANNPEFGPALFSIFRNSLKRNT